MVKFSTCDPMGVPVVLSGRILVFQIDDAAFKFVKCFFTFHLYFLWWEFPEWVLNKAVKGSSKPGCSSVSVSSDVVSVSLFPRLVSTAASRSTTFISRMSSSVNSDDWVIRIHNYYYAEYLKKYIKYILWSLIIFVQNSWSRVLKHKRTQHWVANLRNPSYEINNVKLKQRKKILKWLSVYRSLWFFIFF